MTQSARDAVGELPLGVLYAFSALRKGVFFVFEVREKRGATRRGGKCENVVRVEFLLKKC